MSLRSDLASIAKLIAPEVRSYLKGLTSLAIVNVGDVLSPIFLGVAIDLTVAHLGGTAAATPALLGAFGISVADWKIQMAVGMFLSLHILSNIFRYPMLMYVAVPSHRIVQGVRNRLAAHYLSLSRPFYDTARTGDLMSHATNDLFAVRMMLGPGILIGTDTFILFSLVCVVLVSVSLQLTLLALIPLPIIALITNYLSHQEFQRFEAVQADLSKLTERARESFAGIRVLQSYGREPFDIERFSAASENHLKINLRLARVNSTFNPTLDLMIGLSSALVLIFGGRLVVSGRLSVGEFVSFLFLVNYLSGPMVGFGWAVSLFQRGRASLGRVQTLFAVPVQIADAEPCDPMPLEMSLDVEHLSFRFADEAPEVLHDISFSVPAGKSIGIIGAVGSGKSTLASLLVRMYDPPPNSIKLGGVDIRRLRQNELRRRVVLAPQDTFLFSDTIARNIIGTQDPEAAGKFAELAELHAEIESLPDAYSTMLGERGVNLSGGQRQRLAIARALAADPGLLVLDDCLSAVDAKKEEAILANLREVLRGKTNIVISHRICAVRDADEIIVLDNGTIAERGTHAQLMELGGYYFRIATEQGHASAQSEGVQ